MNWSMYFMVNLTPVPILVMSRASIGLWRAWQLLPQDNVAL